MRGDDASAPIIVAAIIGRADFLYLDALRQAHFPPARYRLPAHLTLFHHLPPSLAAELDARLRAATARVRPPVAILDAVMLRGRGVAMRVRSDGLASIRAELAAAFAGCLIPQDQAGWRPHVTIQNKATTDEARTLHSALSGSFVARPLHISGLATHFYRGGPWEPIAEYRFSG